MLLNTAAQTRRYLITIYGASGTGKTTLGTTAPKPLFLLTERQGYESIRDASGVTPPTFFIGSYLDLRAAIMILRSSKSPIADLIAHFVPEEERDAALAAMPYLVPETIVLDSLTEAFALVSSGVEKDSPAKVAKDGLPERGMRATGAIIDRCIGLLRTLRDLLANDFHVLLLSHLDDRDVGEGDSKSRVIGPTAPMRRIGAQIPHVSNAVGISERRKRVKARREGDEQHQTETVWCVNFSGSDWMITKSIHGLRDIEHADVGKWLARINQTCKTTDSKEQSQ